LQQRNKRIRSASTRTARRCGARRQYPESRRCRFPGSCSNGGSAVPTVASFGEGCAQDWLFSGLAGWCASRPDGWVVQLIETSGYGLVTRLGIGGACLAIGVWPI
jgi:hypothetical protein